MAEASLLKSRITGAIALIIGVSIAAIVEFTHEPGHLLRPELYAEDGPFWYKSAYHSGLASLLLPAVGYLQTVSRLIALLATFFPLTSVPRIFALSAFCFQLLPVILILSERASPLIPSRFARILLAAFYVGAPNSFEVYINLTNVMWNLALTAFLVIILPKPKTIIAKIFDYAVLLISGLSGPIIIFNAVIAWWTCFGEYKKNFRANLTYAILTSACAVTQLFFILSNPAARPYQLGATFPRFIHIFLNQIIFGGTIGNHVVARLMLHPWWSNFFPAILFFILAICFGIIAFIRGPSGYRKFVFLSAGIFLSALRSPEVTQTAPQWFIMQNPGAGDRYYVIPILCWFVTLMILSVQRWYFIPNFIGQWVARLMILSCCIGMVHDWHYDPLQPSNFHNVAKQFDHAPVGTLLLIPEEPVWWSFYLTKH